MHKKSKELYQYLYFRWHKLILKHASIMLKFTHFKSSAIRYHEFVEDLASYTILFIKNYI